MKLRFILKSFDASSLYKASNELYSLCKALNCKTTGVVALPVRIKKYCVLRSPHIDKDSRETFELRIHKHFLDIHLDNPMILDQLLQIEISAGILCSFKILME